MHLTDIIGTIGVGLIVYAYFRVQAGHWRHDMPRLPLTNLIGAICVLISLMRTPNLPSIVIECIWVAISLFGLWRIYGRRR